MSEEDRPEGPFRNIARLYDMFSDAPGRLDREGALLQELLAQAPGSRVIDLACGTGLHAEFLASHDADVTAMDISPEMVAYACARRGRVGITFRTGDMAEVSGGPWDLALCLGNSLSLLPSDEAVARFFERVYGVLSPGGLLAVQVLNYRSPAAQEPRHRVERKQVDGHRIVAVKSLVPDADHTLLSLSFFDSRDGGETASLADASVLRHVTDEELVQAAERAGFAVRGLWGGFDQSSYEPDTSTDVVALFARD